MSCILYSGRDSERKALSHFCSEYIYESFWPYEEFLLSLKIPQTFLLFDPLDAETWNALALARVIGGVAELFYIFIVPSARRRGLAASLLKDFEREAKTLYQAESVMLEVRASNAAAIRLYEKFSYECIHMRKRYYQNGEDALIYSKALLKTEDGAC